MITLKKFVLTAAIIIFITNLGFSQKKWWGFFFKSDKWTVNTSVNSGVLASVQFGKGWEFEYGTGLEWAPLYKVLYFVGEISYVHQFLNDNSPNNFIFTSNPDKTEMNTQYVRAHYGLKFRINWWDKKEDRNSYLVASYNQITDYLVKETTDLHHNNIITNTDQIYSPEVMWGGYYEMGYSWKINDRLKWDSGIYFYYQLRHISPSVYYDDYKSSLGVKTAIYLTLK